MPGTEKMISVMTIPPSSRPPHQPMKVTTGSSELPSAWW